MLELTSWAMMSPRKLRCRIRGGTAAAPHGNPWRLHGLPWRGWRSKANSAKVMAALRMRTEEEPGQRGKPPSRCHPRRDFRQAVAQAQVDAFLRSEACQDAGVVLHGAAQAPGVVDDDDGEDARHGEQVGRES